MNAHIPTNRRSYLIAIPGILVILAVALYMLSRSGLDKELLRQQVDRFATTMHASAEQRGRDVTFTYREITTEGGLFHKHGLISDAKISVKPLGAPDSSEDAYVINLPKVEIYAKTPTLSAIDIVVPEPVVVTAGADATKKLLTVTSVVPLSLSVAQVEEGKHTYLDLASDLPEKMDFTYLREQQTQGKEDETPALVPVYQTLTLTTAPGGRFHSRAAQDDKSLGEMTTDIRDLRLTPDADAKAEVLVKELLLHSSGTMSEKGQKLLQVKAHVGDITAAMENPYTPLSFSMDAAYESSPASPEAASGTAQLATIKLNDFTLSTKESKLMASADFKNSSGDMLPEGTARITLTNLPYVLNELRTKKLLSAATESLVTLVVEKVSGQKLAEVKDLAIDVNRPHGGAFTIGKTTFEELFAEVLKASMVQAQQRAIDAAKSGGATPAKPTESKPPQGKSIKLEEGGRG